LTLLEAYAYRRPIRACTLTHTNARVRRIFAATNFKHVCELLNAAVTWRSELDFEGAVRIVHRHCRVYVPKQQKKTKNNPTAKIYLLIHTLNYTLRNMDCLGCNEQVIDTEVLRCLLCRDTYHYKCLNITTATYMAGNYLIKTKWHCPRCTNITSRRKNDNTPARSHLEQSLLDNSAMSVEDPLQEQNRPDDTNISYTTQQYAAASNPNFTLEQISKLLDQKLQQNNHHLITHVEHVIQKGINTAIAKMNQELSQKFTELSTQYKTLNEKLQHTNNHIATLEQENLKLKSELLELNERINNLGRQHSEENEKNIVLYGLDEYPGETEAELYPRLSHMFYDILNIDINGFIEAARRIGRKGHRRPIVIELISKRMKKYILENAYYFRNTGFAVSKQLDDQSLKQRKEQRDCLLNARREGKHAVIKNNRLFINGKEVRLTPPKRNDTENCTQITNDQTEVTNGSPETNTLTSSQKSVTQPNVQDKSDSFRG
jgi:regulator of replication initiation timing